MLELPLCWAFYGEAARRVNLMTEICTYCNDVHEFLDFGKNFSGNDTLVCPDRLSDVLVETMPPVDYGALEEETIIERTNIMMNKRPTHMDAKLQLKYRIWQVLLLAVLVLAIIVAANFLVNSYLSYQERTANNELNRELGELKVFAGELIGELKVTRTQLDTELKKNDQSKTTINIDSGNTDTDALCKRAAAFGIVCK